MKMDHKRNMIQLSGAVFIDGFVRGFQKGQIFKGASKKLCVPVLNCYSCPGAWGACPIGSLQNMLQGEYRISFYVLGLIMLFGIFLGRGICGFLCPFGLIQGLLHKLPVPKVKVPEKIDRPLRLMKYGILLIMVILLPLFFRNQFGIGTTWFCKFICPAGTLEAGIPMLFMNPGLRNSIGMLFGWKMTVLVVIILLSVVIYRPFCKYFCPLGAIYSFFNRISVLHMELDQASCVNCKACERACLMNVEVTRNINGPECIRCGKCMDICPKGAISMHLGPKTFRKEENSGKPDKKAAVLPAALILAAAVMIGLQFAESPSTVKTDDGKYFNTVLDRNSMVSLSGKQTGMAGDSVIINQAAGFAVSFAEEGEKLSDPRCLNHYNMSFITLVSYLPARDLALAETGREEDIAAANQDLIKLGYIIREDPEDPEIMEGVGSALERYEQSGYVTEVIASYHGGKIYAVHLPSVPEEGYSEEEKAEASVLLDAFSSIEDHVALFTAGSGINLRSLDTTDINGNRINGEILSGSTVTMVNVWETNCPSCVEELPYLEKMYESPGDGVNIISICGDASAYPDKAREIAEKTGVKFTVIKPDEKLEESVLAYIDGFPYTFFVDAEGNRVGDVVAGAPGTDEQTVIGSYQEALNNALEQAEAGN